MISPFRPAASAEATDVAALFDAGRLRQARRLLNKTKQALADEVGVSPAAIGQYESGVIAPRPDVVNGLASALDVPVRFFASGRPLAPLDSADAHFKSLRSTTAGQRNKALAYTEQVWELTHLLERWVQFPAVNLEVEAHGGSVGDRSRARLGAESLRQNWGVPLDEPFPHLTRQAESNGVVVVFASFASDAEVERISAFSTNKLSRPIVVTPPDRVDDVFAHRFNLAHELGHFVLHREEVHGEIAIEREADGFAGELLMPEKPMRSLLRPRVEWDRLAKLSQVWGVEVKALVYRSRQLGILSEASARRAYQRLATMKSSGLIQPSPTARYEGEMPVLLQRAYDYAESEGASIPSLARELAWHPARVRELLGGGDDRPQLKALL